MHHITSYLIAPAIAVLLSAVSLLIGMLVGSPDEAPLRRDGWLRHHAQRRWKIRPHASRGARRLHAGVAPRSVRNSGLAGVGLRDPNETSTGISSFRP